MLLNLIIVIILYILFIIILFIIPDSWKYKYTMYWNKVFISYMGFTKVNINKDGFDLYEKLRASDKKLLIVANHRSIFDHFVLFSAMGDISFLADKNALVFPGVETVVKKLNGILTKKGKGGTTEQIINAVQNRKAGDSILLVYPDRMDEVPYGMEITPFRSGAFVGKFDILPVVIKYKNYDIDPYCLYSRGQNMFYSFFKKMLGTKCDIDIKILPLQKATNKMSIEQYKDKIYNLMCDEYKKL